MTLLVRIAALLLVLFVLIGCGKPRPVTVNGTVVRDSKPIQVSKTGVVQIVLVPDVAPGTPITTRVGRAEPDGHFVITEVPPGKYKISIAVNDPTPGDDKLDGAFSPANTKIVREIDGKASVNVDVARPEG